MKGLINFIKYNNAVPITLSVRLLGAGSALAATPEVRDAAAAAVLSSQSEVVSIDNTYIANKDLASYTPRAQIIGVTEDETDYHVSYVLATIDIKNYVWQDVQKAEVMRVSKADLGQYRDLGVYVTEQLKQIVDRELAYLGQVQEKERRQLSQAVDATTYGGLIGKFLDSKTEALPGYTPVVVAPPEEYGGMPGTPANTAGSSSGGSSGLAGAGGSSQIGIQVLGNNPARIPLRASYVDLGAVLIDPYNTNVGLHIYMNGVETSSPNLDTSTTTSYAIEYRATDLQGNSILARRIVLVGDAPDPGGEISEVGNLLSAAPTPAPEPAPEPAPVSEPAATTTPIVEEPAATTTPVVEPEPAAPVVEEPASEPAPVVAPATDTASSTAN